MPSVNRVSRARRLRSLVAVGLLALASGGLANTWMTPPALPDVEVQDQDGRKLMFYSDLVRGRTVAINFIFAGCTTICPPQTAVLRDVQQAWRKSSGDKLLLISVTVDPWNDQPPQLKAYAKQYDLATGVDQGWVFVTGREQDVRKILAALGALSSGRDNHLNIVWIGNEPRQRWTRAPGFNLPKHYTQLLQDVTR